MILYKYRTISDNTDKIFKNKQVWLSNAKNLNDPFECSIQEIAKDWIEEKIREGMQAHILGFIDTAIQSLKNNKKFFNLNPKLTKIYLKKFKKISNLEDAYIEFRNFIKKQIGNYPTDMRETFSNFDKQLNKVGIFSLTETAENQLMWAHYSSESRGLAIGFEVEEKSKLSNKEHCLKVNYSDTLPAMLGNGLILETSFLLGSSGQLKPEQRISFSDPTFKLAVITKPTCWSYEREWRYIEEECGAYPLPSKISEIVFGLRCSNENRLKYKKLVEDNISNKVSYFEIQKIQNTNKIKKKILFDS